MTGQIKTLLAKAFGAGPGAWLGLLSLRSEILRCSFEGGADQVDACGAQMNARRTVPSPTAGARIERAWRFFQKRPLLLRGELHHSMVLVGIPKRRENLTFDAEMRMADVCRLPRSRNLEG